MTTDHIGICRATLADIDGILALQDANQPENGGRLSARLPRAAIKSMISIMPVIVARRAETVVGFLMISSARMNAGVPIIKAMQARYPMTSDEIIYGPICVSAEERGRGLAARLYAELGRLQPGLRFVLFIRRDNEASIKAHIKLGMHEMGEFDFDGASHLILSHTA